jgi:pimeloyl-ACP methyl ester carboxylesterase
VSPRSITLSGGAQIQYLDVGSGPPVVYFHGAGGVFSNAAFVPALGQRYRVVAPSRPGYDGSTGTAETARDEADVMVAFIREVVDGPVHLVAESAGGAAGCWVAILQPELVTRLVLVAPAAFAHAVPAEQSTPEAREQRLFGPQPAWTEPPTAEDRAARQRNALANAAKMRPANANRDLLERLHEVAAPTLLLWGTADEVVPPEAGQPFQERIPTCYRVLIYGAAHVLPVAACRQFVALTTDFFERGEAFVVNQPSP